jgi:allantoinase
MWTNLRNRGFDIPDLTRLMSAAPARLASLGTRKGKLAAGFDADIVIWDPDAAFTVRPELVYHRHKLTPYTGMELFGTVESVYVRGRQVFGDGEFACGHTGSLIT